MAAVTAAVLIVAPPLPFGSWKRIAPLIRFISRVPSLKLKIVFAPRRVMVRSVKVNSLRDSVPVRTAVPGRTGSLTVAGRGAACSASSLTSFTTWVTRASFNCAALAEVATAAKQVKADETAMNRVCAVPPNSFFMPGRMLVIGNGERRRCRLVYYWFEALVFPGQAELMFFGIRLRKSGPPHARSTE